MNTYEYINYLFKAAKRNELKEMLAETPDEKRSARLKRSKYLNRIKAMSKLSNVSGSENAARSFTM